MRQRLPVTFALPESPSGTLLASWEREAAIGTLSNMTTILSAHRSHTSHAFCKRNQTLISTRASGYPQPTRPPPAISVLPGLWIPTLSEGRKPSLSPVADWKLPPEDVGEGDAWVYADSLNFIAAISDHEE